MAKILVVDDQEDIRLSVSTLVKKRGGHDVVTAVDGLDALRVFNEEKPDLIISDVNMPNCDGHEFVKRLHELPEAKFVPIIFLSARTSLNDQKLGFESGVDNYICKPIDREQRPVFLAMIETLIVRSQARRTSLEEASKCKLTNLQRRDAFLTDLARQVAQDKRDERSSVVAMIDVDHFKQVNDTHGHQVGDKVLEKFACCIKSSLRLADGIYRYGGEEFALIIPNCDIEGAKSIIKRVQSAVRGAIFPKDLPIRFSGGMFEIKPTNEGTLDSFIGNADAALYEAKNNGRDCVLSFKE